MKDDGADYDTEQLAIQAFGGNQGIVRTCTVCSHPAREEIDRQLVAGVSLRQLARQYETDKSALCRHKAHVSGAIAEARAEELATNAGGLLEQVREDIERCRRLVFEAEKILASAGSNERLALNAISTACRPMRELRAYRELLAEVTGELDRSSTTQVEVTQQVAIIQGLPRRELLERLVEAGQAAARELQEQEMRDV